MGKLRRRRGSKCCFRERWLIAAENDPDGRPNSLFVLYMRETIYFSDIPTGTPDDAPG